MKVYACDETAEIDADCIIYFALSVFWRAAVANWEGQPSLTLGPYEHELANYLLRKGTFLMSTGLVVTVNNAPTTRFSMIAPHQKRGVGYYQYGFFIPGMTFDLFVGGKLPRRMLDRSCIATAPRLPIFLASTFEDAVRNAHLELGA